MEPRIVNTLQGNETLKAQLQDKGLLFVRDPESSITRLLVCCLFETLKAQLQD